MKLRIFTDGGSRGNPGEAAIGAVISNLENGQKLAEVSKCIGIATNNIAEYSAVLEALNWVRDEVGKCEIEFFLDSELVVRQLNGIYKIKDPGLKIVYLKIREIILDLELVCAFTAIRREKNREADALVNKALDSQCS